MDDWHKSCALAYPFSMEGAETRTKWPEIAAFLLLLFLLNVSNPLDWSNTSEYLRH